MRRARTSCNLQALDNECHQSSSQSPQSLDDCVITNNTKTHEHGKLQLHYTFQTDESSPPVKRRARAGSIPTLPKQEQRHFQQFTFPSFDSSNSPPLPSSPLQSPPFICPHVPSPVSNARTNDTTTSPPILGGAHSGSYSFNTTTRRLSRPSPTLSRSLKVKSFSFTCPRWCSSGDESPPHNSEDIHMLPQTDEVILDTISSISLQQQQQQLTLSASTISDYVLLARSPNSGVPVSNCSASLVHQEMLFGLFGVFGVLCVVVGWLENTLQLEATKQRHQGSF